ncbi:MAG: SCO family protein [Actinomycetota bacterium]
MTLISKAVAITLMFGGLATALSSQTHSVLPGTSVRPADNSTLHQHHMAATPASTASASAKNYSVTDEKSMPPDVTLMDRRGKPVRLSALLQQPRPVLLEFIFTTCATICPLLTATFSQAQKDVARISPDYLMISISIDPEYDTPARLDEYARRYHPADNWLFLTGKKKDIFQVLKSFDALFQSDNKMYHRPYMFLRARSGDTWRRLEGFPKTSDLIHEYREVVTSPGGAGKEAF